MMKYIHDEVGETSPDANAALARLFELAVVLGEFMERGLVDRGLTRARASVIWQLYHRGPVTQRELSEGLDVTPRNITGLVDALERDGFVARTPHPSDRRATLVTLTKRGESTAAALTVEYEAGADLLFAEVPADELASFIRTLDHVLGWLRGGGSAPSDDRC
jgi:DNA-binding MarR family transcriptional regulator